MKRGQPARAASRGSGAAFTAAFGTPSASSLSYLTEPPSFAALSDPNVVVSLKNALKRDSTTKAKALEDLVHHVRAHPFNEGAGVDDALLDIWAQLYPRISIDNSRRVRELSHILQLQLLKSARKRMERHIPTFVGAWLAGLYDRDRVVARAAQDSLSSFLDTPEKLSAFWRRCQSPILDYAVEAVKETRDTLSDERTTTTEDADAKYYRVIAASLSLVLNLLQLESGAIEKSHQKLDAFFAEDVVWKSITFKDPQVRKTTCKLLFTCIERRLPYFESHKAKQAFITGGLKTNQSGSALEYVRALTKLTQYDASLWAASPGEKKSPLFRLQAFIAKGSQGSPATFWEHLGKLLTALPPSKTFQEASALLSALESGITNRDEPRSNASHSWTCFVDAATRCLEVLSDSDALSLANEKLFPLLERYLFFTSEMPAFIPTGPNAMPILVDIHVSLMRKPLLAQAVADEWTRLGSVFCKNMASALPEVSREFQSSQAQTSDQGRRWFGLVGTLHAKMLDLKEKSDIPDGPSALVVKDSFALLESRNLKPYGAAQVLVHALSKAPHLFTGETAQGVVEFLVSIAQDMGRIVGSPSSRDLFSCLEIFGTLQGGQGVYDDIWTRWTKASLELKSREHCNAALAQLVSQKNAGQLAKKCQELQELTKSQVMADLELPDGEADTNTMTFLEAAIVHGALDIETSRIIARDLVAILGKSTQHTESILYMLEVVVQNQPELLGPQEAIRTDLVAQLMALSDIGNDVVSPKAARFRLLLDAQGDGTLPVVEIIHQNLDLAGPQSLEISTLASQGKRAVDTSVRWEDICPNTNIWMRELSSFLEQSLNPALTITSAIGGAATLPHTRSEARKSHVAAQRDRQGRSIPARMALYTHDILTYAPVDVKLPPELHVELLYLQYMTLHLVSDQISSRGEDGPWMTHIDEKALRQGEDLVTRSRGLLKKVLGAAAGWDRTPEKGSSRVVRDLVDLTMRETMELTPRGVYSAKVLAELLQTLTDAHGTPSSLETTFLKQEVLKTTPETTLLAAGLMTGLGDALLSTKAASNFCNRLVSEIAATAPDEGSTRMTLALFALCAQVYELGQLPVASNRIVFATQKITSWTDDLAMLDSDLCADMCRALSQLLLCMKDVYGSYWESTLQFCLALWEHAGQRALDDALPFIHSSLKLFGALEEIQDANDDLQDALRDVATAKSHGLLELMRLPREQESQPLEIVDAILCREMKKMPVARLPEPAEVFSLVTSTSRNIQTAAFEALHRKIPVQQEAQSIDVLLEKTDARLPDELLSLLLDPPTLEKYSDEALSLFPQAVRCYLLSWKLVFDAFSTPSLKVRNDFANHLKSGDFVRPLLDFVFDVLGHSAAQPLNLDKEKIGPEHITSWDVELADAETDEKSMHWLLAHLFYLVLKHVPGLFKTWFLDCRSKQTRIAVEAWTSRYFSPLIVADTLDKVQAWAEAQETGGGGGGGSDDDDDKELVVKVSRAVREVTAGYEVDDAQAAIVIKMPADYPIGAVGVAGLHRVAVTERKWQSWIMTTQGVIAFSNGSIVDGLQVFRRNVAGALKGQSECAICYSIISADRRMPDKRCATCKNPFHRSCLYKWFQSSNQNTCPLCRNPIDYLGADTARRRQNMGGDQF